MPTTLIVSPHLDDAALSIGGSIAAWLAAGERVVVASVYTTGPPLAEIAPSMRPFANYARRREEDQGACGVLGAELRWLDQVERAFRKPYLTNRAYFRTPEQRAGFDTLPQVTAAIAAVGDELAPDRIVVPLGIGNHVDHVEALLAATDWALAANLGDRLWFYEDFYALSRTMRRRHPVARTRVWRSWESPLLHARRLGVILRAISLAARGPTAMQLLAPPLRDARWTVTSSSIREHEHRKLAAIACYRSQTRAFGGLAGISRALRSYHSWWGGAEPLWRASFR
jgi:LmbE family N-acetylglucosaminyl deacetylase